jgi:heme o synthase
MAELAAAPRRPLLRARLFTDYLSLTKPRIVLLLVITEMGALIAASPRHLGLGLVVVAVVGGAMSAGGAAAVNCWFDRELDREMERTCDRPLPAGRISSAGALLFGLAVGLGGVAVLAVGANLLAGALAAAGGVFYAVVYTMWLKRSTTQNIVIGGAAGAFPPLVGWAAATGTLSPLAWLLFAVIFFWTPPHFWALALLVRKQYTRAQVPMLPAVRGERVTRAAIVFYAALLVVVSLMPALWLGALYLPGSLALDAILLALAIASLREAGRRWAAALFHYSIAYLGLLFVNVAVTSVLRP